MNKPCGQIACNATQTFYVHFTLSLTGKGWGSGVFLGGGVGLVFGWLGFFVVLVAGGLFLVWLAFLLFFKKDLLKA